MISYSFMYTVNSLYLHTADEGTSLVLNSTIVHSPGASEPLSILTVSAADRSASRLTMTEFFANPIVMCTAEKMEHILLHVSFYT